MTAARCTGCGGPLVLSAATPGKLIVTTTITVAEDGTREDGATSGWCATCVAGWNEAMGAT